MYTNPLDSMGGGGQNSHIFVLILDYTQCTFDRITYAGTGGCVCVCAMMILRINLWLPFGKVLKVGTLECSGSDQTEKSHRCQNFQRIKQEG